MMKNKGHFGVLAIATAMLGAMLLSSCNHDEYFYSEENVEKSINDKYAAAFEKAFGKVGPNVDWGFSNKNAAARAITRAGEDPVDYASYRGNMRPTLDPPFPSDCDASNFLDAVPEGVGKLPTWGAGPGSYYVDAESPTVSTWSGASKIYVTGTVDLSDEDASANPWKFAPDNTSEIYLVKGSKLILGAASAKNFNVAAIYIAEGATLESKYSLWANTNTKIYNHGTINVGSFEPNTSSFLYNVGTMKAGSVTAESNPTRIVNDGIIDCASVTVNAGAVQNNYEWTVTGTTRINSNNSGWVNNGHWTTKDYAYVGGSWNVINNCFLEVTNDFEMNISSVQGAFKIDGGGGVLTNNFYGGRDSSTGAVSGPFVIQMGPKAVFVVKETAQLESGRSDEEGFGIFGPKSGEYAVFQAKNIVRDPYLESINSHGAVTYGGNLYVSAETHFKQGYDSDGTGTYNPRAFIIDKDDNDGFTIDNNIYGEGFKSGKPNITIDETPCSPGFKGDDPVLYRVIAEDLSAAQAGDFDFNDVVFDIVKAEGGKTTLRLICAGGVLPLRVAGQEVHHLFGETEEKNEYPMYNTGAGPIVPPVEFDIDGTFIEPVYIKNIKIEVFKEGDWMELKATTGKAACKILVDSSFKPVTERHNIADDYDLFTDYVQGYFKDEFWWKKGIRPN